METLGDFEDKRGVGPLIELARTHSNVDVRRDHSTRPHVFRAAIAQAQVERRFVTDLLEQVFEGSATSLAMHALSVKRASREDLRKLRELLDEIEGDES